MNCRGALLVSLARKKKFQESKVHGKENFSERNKFDIEDYDKKFRNIQDWIDKIPEEESSFIPNENKKIKILSDVILKRGAQTVQNDCNTMEAGIGLVWDNANTSEKSSSTGSIVPSTVYSGDLSREFEEIFSVDDSLKDPDYEPSSDEEKSCSIPSREVVDSKEDANSNHSKSLGQLDVPLVDDSLKEVISRSSESYNIPSQEVVESKKDANSNHSKSSEQYDVPLVDDSLKEVIAKSNEEDVERVGKLNYKDRRDFCMFCEKNISHFARHINTWHSSEIEVARILSLQNPKERRIMYSNLRKRGNFIHNRTNTKLRPVKRIKFGMIPSAADDFLPCKYCLGFYKKKSLYRHTKVCSQNAKVNVQKRQTSQSDGQTTLLLRTLLKHDELLNVELFPRMRADDISLIAKKDSLICQYAYSYIKGRRSKGNLDLVRQNVRRLAKLLRFAQQRDSTIKLFIDILRPCHFKMIIDGVNEMAQFNNNTEKYESPTLAINFGTLLKKCCDLAFIELLQKPCTNDQREGVIQLKNLIVSQWADEVSAQAGTNLHENKWNKEELLPLTSDLKKMSNFLFNAAEQQYNILKVNNHDSDAYYALKDILYTQILLLNRRRPAEVAQLKVQTYQTINLDTSKHDTEFENCLTETERILLNTYSRFIIRGKRGRGVPVLLSPTMKQHFEVLVTIRDNFVTNNDYIFHTKGRGFIDGTKTLQKYVQKCGITRSKSMTATLLRKHLATITQLLQFSNNDMEQLSKFMGHTLKTHCDVYRMSDNLFQTAKISKLLLLMTEGGAENFKGKKLEDIDIQLTPVEEKYDLFEELIDQYNSEPQFAQHIVEEERVEQQPIEEAQHKNAIHHQKQSTKETERHPWTRHQKHLIAKYFAKNIKQKHAPKQAEVNKFVELYPELFRERKWTSIKAVVYNIYTGKLKIK